MKISNIEDIDAYCEHLLNKVIRISYNTDVITNLSAS